ncbi:hypothetical protein V7793_25410, partial [Streptomyces sp. KLMMK]|uniref:hypothetical protein n=1 Tax=Streptomyces sp. KLMMK TaxID=3109353 RepID=UPI003B62B036
MKQEPARNSLWSPPTFVTATGALVAEATLAIGAFVLWSVVHPDAAPGSGGAGDPSEDDSGALGLIVIPFVLAVWTLLAAFLAAVLVVPA